MPDFDAVVFDLFGTLVPKWSRVLALENNARMAGDLGVPVENFQRTWDTTFQDRETGRLPGVEDALRHVAAVLDIAVDESRIALAASRRLELHHERVQPRDGVDATLAELVERGLRVGLLSNISAPGASVFRELAIRRHFTSLIFSCEEGMVKPDPAIYARSVAQLGTPPERCLFVGDGGSCELTAARKAGMTSVLIRVDSEIEEEGWPEDAAEWQGPTIARIPQVLDLV
jgi:putative hydrolase of the HAD superfamily